MPRISLLVLFLALGAPVLAGALARPSALSVDPQSLRISWAAVPGAGLYRVAVFDAPDSSGKRLLLAAVWVAGEQWVYGGGPVVPRAAHLASTRPLPLPAGHQLRVMVAAAGAEGADKSDWAGTDFIVPAVAAPRLSPTAVASPSPSAQPSPVADATLEVDGGEEFKSSPDPAVIDLQDATPTADVAVALSPTGEGLQAAQALLSSGQDDAAESAFRSLLAREPRNADAWEGLGDSYVGRSMKVEAADAYKKAVAIDGSKTRLKDWLTQNLRE